MCDVMTLSYKIDALMKSIALILNTDELHEKIFDFIHTELKDVKFLSEELEKYKTLCYKTKSNYINQLSQLKHTYETALINEREQHQRDLESKWENICHQANMAAMKKYQGIKYEKLKLDVEFSADICDLEAIKFH